MANSESITPKVLFRADGNQDIGLGHLMRCLALAEMLGPAYRRRLAIVQPVPAVVHLIEEKGIETVWLERSEHFVGAIEPDEVTVLDGYGFDEAYQRTVREQAKTLVYIDDLVTGHQVADVVINHAGGVTSNDYQAEPYTQFLLGPHYAMLRLPFFVPQTSIPQEGPIFVSLGGADPSNTTVRVLEGLFSCFKTLKQEWRVHVVIGPMQQNRPTIEAFQIGFRHLKILSSLTAEQMVAELNKCQLSITACSTVAYEVCSVGRPLIAIQTADNQERIARFLQQNELTFINITTETLADQLAGALVVGLQPNYIDFRKKFVKNQRRFFDGQSPERLRALFNRLTT